MSPQPSNSTDPERDTADAGAEIASGERFEFGANWQRFLADLSDERIRAAEASLRDWLGGDLAGQRFLDIGSGSGLFSLAAVNLGATVHSFDFDPASVACTRTLKQRYHPDSERWRIEQGSALDQTFLAGLGEADVVYSWGVLHHTGAMHRAMHNAVARVKPGGRLFIAIYNDQGWISRYWTGVKRLYNRGGAARAAMIALHTPYLFAARWALRTVTGRGRLERGMSLWHDMIDWLGGYPFEVASPAAVQRFMAERGAALLRCKDCGRRMGCNEFLFEVDKRADSGPP